MHSKKIVVKHKRTGEEFDAWQDPEGLWIVDPAEGNGYDDPAKYEVIG